MKNEITDSKKEVETLQAQLEAAQKEILRLQNICTNLEITARTQATLIQVTQLIAPSDPSK